MKRDYPHGRKSVGERKAPVCDDYFATAEWHAKNRDACDRLLALLQEHHGRKEEAA